MARFDVVALCLGCVVLGFLLGHSFQSRTDSKLDALNGNLTALNDSISKGIQVRADVDILGIGARRLAMYQNQGNDWVIGSKDETSPKIDPVMLFNFDWAKLETAPDAPSSIQPLVPKAAGTPPSGDAR